MTHCQFEHAVEHHPAAARVSSIEAKDELIEIAGQMSRVDRALVGPQEPPLGQCGDAMNAGEQRVWILATQPSRPLTAPLMDIAERPGSSVLTFDF